MPHSKGLRWTNLPFAPNRLPFHYGWVIILLSPLGVLASVPGQTIGVSAFTDPLLDTLPLDRGQLSLAYLIGTLTSGLMLIRIGRLYDRYGARVLAPSAAGALGVVLFFLSQSERVTTLLDGRLPAFLSPAATATLVMTAPTSAPSAAWACPCLSWPAPWGLTSSACPSTSPAAIRQRRRAVSA